MPELLVHDSPISYRTHGSGEPVMLLHAGGSNSRQWVALVSELGDHRLCLLPDFHGHGASPPWREIRHSSLEDYVAIVEALENIAGRPFHLVGQPGTDGTVELEAVRNDGTVAMTATAQFG